MLPVRPQATYSIPHTLEGLDSAQRMAVIETVRAAAAMEGPLVLLDRLADLHVALSPLPVWNRIRVSTDFDGDVFVNVNLDEERDIWVEVSGGDDVSSVMEQARALGADGIVVSNHGGRALDSSMATIDALPDIVAAVGGKMTVFLDSGIRRGSDLVKALALGADAVLVGRAPLYGLSAAGEAGVSRALALLQAETSRTMAMLGARSIAEVDASLLA